MSRASQQAKALADIREGATDQDITRRYGYGKAVINAMRATISRETNLDTDIDIDKEGPEF